MKASPWRLVRTTPALERARKCLEKAKAEPGHTPTEDALIDALEALIEETGTIQPSSPQYGGQGYE